MATWALATLLLCTFGFVKELRPTDSYLNNYLTGPWVNLTEEQVYNEVYPVWTYSYLCLLLPVLLLTDILRYKPVIIAEALGYIATYVLALWGNEIQAFKGMEVAYGVATATEVAYYSYIYALVEKDKYQRVTSYTRTALLLGRFTSSSLAQILISTGAMNFKELNYISLGGACTCFLVAIALPSAKHSVYFHRNIDDTASVATKEDNTSDGTISNNSEECNKEIEDTVIDASLDQKSVLSLKQKKHKCSEIGSVFKIIWHDMVSAFTNIPVLKWSIWSALATCGLYQVQNYSQSLWEEIKPSEADSTDVYNGAVIAMATLFGAGGSFVMQFVSINWGKYGEPILAITCTVEAVFLVAMALTDYISIAYVTFILAGILYNAMMTVASFQVAKNIREDTFGLVFGITTFASLFVQTLLTVIIVSDYGFAAPIRTQFLVYGGYFGVIAILFLSTSIYTWIQRK